jgi:phage/plasmid-associated DNA primase
MLEQSRKKKIRKFKKEKGENEQKNEIFIREKNLRVSFFFLLFLGVVRYENGNLYGMWQVKSKREG